MESYLAAVGVLDRVLKYWEPFDAVIQAGFGEHEAVKAFGEALDVPVVDITESAAIMASLLGHKFGVVAHPRSHCPLDRGSAAPGWPERALRRQSSPAAGACSNSSMITTGTVAAIVAKAGRSSPAMAWRSSAGWRNGRSGRGGRRRDRRHGRRWRRIRRLHLPRGWCG